jgi:hypothetical protein
MMMMMRWSWCLRIFIKRTEGARLGEEGRQHSMDNIPSGMNFRKLRECLLSWVKLVGARSKPIRFALQCRLSQMMKRIKYDAFIVIF